MFIHTHVGAPTSTHLPGFHSFLMFFASFCIDQISHQQHSRVKVGPALRTLASIFFIYSL